MIQQPSAATAASLEDIKRRSNHMVEALCGSTEERARAAHAYRALLSLQQDDGLAASELAQRLCVSRPQVRSWLVALEQTDLVHRAGRGRRARFWLTPQGRALVATLLAPVMRERFERLRPEIEALRDLLLDTLGSVEGVAGRFEAA